MTEQAYVLITPARNEEAYIENTIKAVIRQTALPKKWVIVSDGSTDHTDEIISKYAEKYEYIKVVRVANGTRKDFSSKVNAFNSGYEHIRSSAYSFIGNLDADVTFDSYYYENILKNFCENLKLGIAGGEILELRNGIFKSRIFNTKSVAGAVQLFRRECFEDIGGYSPIKMGGIDAVAEISARMKGWEVRTFTDLKVYHHRCIGVTKGSIFFGKFRYGVRDNLIGNHPLFVIGKYIDRFREKPYVIGGMIMMGGFLSSWAGRHKRPVQNELVKYLRHEQMLRLRKMLSLKRTKGKRVAT